MRRRPHRLSVRRAQVCRRFDPLFCAAPGLHGRRSDLQGWRDGHAWWESVGLADARRHASRTGAWIALVTQAGSTVDEDFPDPALRSCRRTATSWPGCRIGTGNPDGRRAPCVRGGTCTRGRRGCWSSTSTGRALLVRFSDDFGHTWWAAPGGGLNPGGSSGSGARELERRVSAKTTSDRARDRPAAPHLSFNSGHGLPSASAGSWRGMRGSRYGPSAGAVCNRRP